VTPVSGILRLANVQLAFTRPVTPSWHSNVQWHHVAPVTPSHAQSCPVTPSGARLHLVAVRSHFGLRLDGRINPARASNRPGRRINHITNLFMLGNVSLFCLPLQTASSVRKLSIPSMPRLESSARHSQSSTTAYHYKLLTTYIEKQVDPGEGKIVNQ
jgi:hypothetical protein